MSVQLTELCEGQVRMERRVDGLYDQLSIVQVGSQTTMLFDAVPAPPPEPTPKAPSGQAGVANRHPLDQQHYISNDEEARKACDEVLRATSPEPSQSRPAMPDSNHVRRLVATTQFDALCLVIILANTFMTGYTVQVAATSDSGRAPRVLDRIQLLFTLTFLVEVLLRMIAFKKDFWVGSDACWNMYDLGISLLALVEPITEVFIRTKSGSTNLCVLRALRLFRIVRLMRVIQIFRFFRELRMMLASILNSSRYILWASIILWSLNYMTAVFLTQVSSEHRSEDPNGDLAGELALYFGTLPLATYSLFLCVTGGISWGEVARPLIEVHWLYGLLMAAFVGFTVFAVLNVITAGFVENAKSVAQADIDNVMAIALENEKEAVCRLREMFSSTDRNGSGSIEFAEFERFFKDERASAAFHTIGLDVTELHRLFRLLDMDCSGTVDIEEFVEGCLRLKGQATSLDLASLMYENKRMMRKWSRFMDFVTMQFTRLSAFEDRVLGSEAESLPPGVNKRLAERARAHWKSTNQWGQSMGSAMAASAGRKSWNAAAGNTSRQPMFLSPSFEGAF